MVLPGENSVIVPLPSVVVVVVVVSETCAHANGAAAANAMLSTTFLMFSLPVPFHTGRHNTPLPTLRLARRSHYLFGPVGQCGCVSGKAKVSQHLVLVFR